MRLRTGAQSRRVRTPSCTPATAGAPPRSAARSYAHPVGRRHLLGLSLGAALAASPAQASVLRDATSLWTRCAKD